MRYIAQPVNIPFEVHQAASVRLSHKVEVLSEPMPGRWRMSAQARPIVEHGVHMSRRSRRTVGSLSDGRTRRHSGFAWRGIAIGSLPGPLFASCGFPRWFTLRRFQNHR